MDLMAAGLSFRAISELIKNNNLQGLKLFLDSRHANIEDRDEVGTRICFFAKFVKSIYCCFLKNPPNQKHL